MVRLREALVLAGLLSLAECHLRASMSGATPQVQPDSVIEMYRAELKMMRQHCLPELTYPNAPGVIDNRGQKVMEFCQGYLRNREYLSKLHHRTPSF
jgi:hypothetical protein